MTILGISSVTIKSTGGDTCLEGMDPNKVDIAKCVPNAPSQDWIVDGDHIKNKKVGKCIADSKIRDRILLKCEVSVGNENPRRKDSETKIRQMRIQGTELRNVMNECLYLGVDAYFSSCESKHSAKYKAVVQ
jgi:hypothetical protein